ncbi:hypothetical protein F4604DRAFT_1910813 [Suillus subluteus]|nr:hypothetical protein F4604DRAFT_1910813 [Suillus subluteus]
MHRQDRVADQKELVLGERNEPTTASVIRKKERWKHQGFDERPRKREWDKIWERSGIGGEELVQMTVSLENGVGISGHTCMKGGEGINMSISTGLFEPKSQTANAATMQLTFVTDLGESYAVDIDPDMELENVMALLEAELRTWRNLVYMLTKLWKGPIGPLVRSSCPWDPYSNGRELTDPKVTIRELGVGEHAILLLRRRVNVPGPEGSSSSFPGGGNTLGLVPTPRASTRPTAAQSQHPDSAIELIMGLGVSREVTISMLDAAGGNVDAAASLLL